MKIYTTILLLILSIASQAQNTFKAIVKDYDKHALPGVVVSDKHGHGGATDDSGRVTIANININPDTFYFTFIGYRPDTLIAKLNDEWHEVTLGENGKELEEVVFVSTTRTNERIENAPLKVEVLGKEDLEEENTIRPANIAFRFIIFHTSGKLRNSDKFQHEPVVCCYEVRLMFETLVRDVILF